MRKLKDIEVRVANIKIKRLQGRTKEGICTSNKTLGWTVYIRDYGRVISFFEVNKRKLWKRIKEEVFLG